MSSSSSLSSAKRERNGGLGLLSLLCGAVAAAGEATRRLRSMVTPGRRGLRRRKELMERIEAVSEEEEAGLGYCVERSGGGGGGGGAGRISGALRMTGAGAGAGSAS